MRYVAWMGSSSKMPRNGNGTIAHVRRPFVADRPVHVTHHVREDVGSLRQQWIMDLFRALVRGCRGRGLRVVAWVIMGNHIHCICVSSRRADQADGLRYLFGKLARAINTSLRRRGKVFVERFFSVAATTARHAWRMMGYLLRNPTAAGLRPPPGELVDAYTGFEASALDSNAWMIGVFGPRGAQRRSLLLAMTRRPAPLDAYHRRAAPTSTGSAAPPTRPARVNSRTGGEPVVGSRCRQTRMPGAWWPVLVTYSS